MTERPAFRQQANHSCVEAASFSASDLLELRQYQNGIRFLLGTTALIAVLSVMAPEAQAQQYWDGTDTTSGNGAPTGGSGTWDGATTNWTDDAVGTTNQSWASGDAVFGGTAGTITVSGTQTTTGMTFDTGGYTVTGGTLAVGGATIDGGSGATTISSTLTGAGLNKVGTGTLTISGTTNITGRFKVAEGGVVLGVGAFDDPLSSIWLQDDIDPVGSQVTLDLGGNTVATTTLVVNGVGTTELSNGTVEFSGTADIWYATVSADLTGSGSLVKSGSGTATLEGTNTYTGSTLVRQRTLSLAAGSSIASTTVTIGDASTTAKPILIAETGTLATGTDLTINTGAGLGGEFRNERDNSITTLNTSDADAEVTLNGGTLTITGGGTVAGVVAGAANLTNNGGTLTLTGTANTATGTLTNTSGIVNLADWSGSINNSATTNFTGSMTLGGTVTNNSGASLNNESGAAIVVGGVTTFTSAGTVTGATGLTFNATNVTYQDGHTEAGTVDINVATGGTLTEERTGDQNFSGSVDYNVVTGGAANFTATSGFTTTGTLTHGSSGTFTVANNQTVSAATINLNSGTAIIGDGATLQGTGNTMNIAVATAAGAGATLTDANDINILAAGSATYAGAGTLSVNTDGAGAEGITIDGALNVTGGGTVTTTVGGTGTIVTQGTGTIDVSNAGSHLDATGETITNNSTAATGINVGAGSQLTAANITNGTGATLSNAGTVTANVSNTTATSTLTTSDTITGDVTNTLGTVNAAGVISGTVTQNSGTFTLTAALSAGALSGAGDITNGGSLLTLDGDADATGETATYSGAISGTGGLTINVGEDTQVLSGANTYSGTTTITSGTLELSGGSAIADTGEIANAGTLLVSTAETVGALNGAGAVTLSATLTTGDAGDDTISGNITGAGGLTKAGAGTLTLSGTNDYTGTTTVSAGTLELSGGSAIVDMGEIANAGTLLVSTAETVGALNGAGGVTLNSTLTTGDAGNDTISGVISGSGGLTKQGSGNLILSGVNTYSGATTVSSGHLQIDQSLTGGAVVNAGAFLTNNGTIAGTVTNNGTVTSASAIFGGLTNSSTFNASGSTVVNGPFSNSGTASMLNGATGDTITVNGNMSGGGQLNLDVNYATNTGDSLLVNGSTSGVTTVSLNSLTTDNPAIGSELTVVTVTGTTNASDFVLAGGPLVAGIYSYDLALASGEWALSGQLNAVGEAYETAPIALGELLYMPTLEQRRGQARNLAASDEGKSLVGGSWGRVFANKFESELGSSTNGTAVDANISGFQAGYDYVVPDGQNGTWVLGLTGQVGTVGSTTPNSTSDAKSLALGATATWFGNDGWYADGQLQFSFLEINFSADGTDLAENEKGYGVGLSAEFGKRITLSSSSAIVPHAQINWTRLDGGTFTDLSGNSVSMENIQSKRGRLGLAYEYFDQPNNTKLYAVGSIVHGFSSNNTVVINDASLKIGELGTWAEFGVGVSKYWGVNRKFYAEMSSRQSLNSESGSSFGITAGIEFKL
ncbi:autotransporter outer membrane beta-barrel domain-containing protein [Parasedimentitalea psychrophila]|uniref:Autotransporter outer membrane beta-barrel domain-containing protein n=1 Tax=Parasedimentitalea psychrophila TaxID=2997337 RepID=A0A9Y2P622_9RHOB|nr:autotransporter outer membrane beta-barrel domain-containing protein [Parasedimentitalea psychrophila]WIY24210.1 autotransporter outer membrane beta-barrel domain-containing protein [Parasedimentitalea psychrophila]